MHLWRTRFDRAVKPVGSWRTALAGSVLWAIAVAGAAGMADRRITGWIDLHLSTILAIYFLGGFAAFVPSIVTAGLVANGRRAGVRLAASAFALVVHTVATTGIVYGFQYMREDIDWTGFPGAAFPFMDIPKSMIGALIYYAVLGVRLLAPEGLFPLLLASFWIARRLR